MHENQPELNTWAAELNRSPQMQYGWDVGILFPWNLAPLPLDDHLGTICDRFALAGAEDRESFRALLQPASCRTLLDFSQRCAGLALRRAEPYRLRPGAIAIAAIAFDKFDFRDIWYGVYAISYAAIRAGLDAKGLLESTANLAEPESQKIFFKILEKLPNDPEGKSLLWATVQTSQGPAMVRRGIRPYIPSLPLESMSVKIAEMLGKDNYLPRIELATEIPTTWLKGVDDAGVGRAWRNVVAACTVTGILRGTYRSYIYAPCVWVFVGELRDAGDVLLLQRVAELKGESAPNAPVVGVGVGRIFSLLVARSVVQGQEPPESVKTLQRFRPEVEAILSEQATA